MAELSWQEREALGMEPFTYAETGPGLGMFPDPVTVQTQELLRATVPSYTGYTGPGLPDLGPDPQLRHAAEVITQQEIIVEEKTVSIFPDMTDISEQIRLLSILIFIIVMIILMRG